MKKKSVVIKQFALGVFFWFLIISALILTVILPPLFLTKLGADAFLIGNFSTAAQYWQKANLIVKPLGAVTKPFNSDALLWSTTLTLLDKLAGDLALLQQNKEQSLYELPTDTLVSHFPDYLLLLDTIQQNSQSALILKKPLQRYQIQKKVSVAHDWLSAFSPVLNKESKWLILLQNDNELRATGGFMGSYALLSINRGKIIDISIEDIYDADGQFTGYFPPPAGIKEYLSSGNGLRLPDANWHPDFPTSAQQILGYFALGNRQEIIGVIAITNSVIRELLTITGPIPLPDYQTSLTADTIDSVLQNRPQPFFPGSIQKKHLLSQAKNQLLVALSKMTVKDWQSVFTILNEQVAQKNILLASANDAVNTVLENNHLNGKLSISNQNQDLVEIVESNVGINKSNQWQHRAVSVDLTKPKRITITINYSNQSPNSITIDQSRYANYLRFVTNQSWIVESVTINNVNKTQEWNQDDITTIDGHTFQQLGGLLVIEPRTTATISVSFLREANQRLLLIKQPGLPETLYTILKPDGNTQQLILQHDIELSY